MVSLWSVGENVHGTLLCVVADNLAAHGLAGFKENFSGPYPCRFCYASKEEIQRCEATTFELRTKESHDQLCTDIETGNVMEDYGVKANNCFAQHLEYFHTTSGFPPDILHDFLEGVVPMELALYLQELIRNKYFSLEQLNEAILQFPFENADKVDRPQPIPKNFPRRKTIGGNGHENLALIRLLPTIIGTVVPAEDKAWQILMDLKDLVELVLSPVFTEDVLQYLSMKISDHRQLFQEVFPNVRLRPKHHYIEHYPQMIRCFGPLVHFWTIRFEGKLKRKYYMMLRTSKTSLKHFLTSISN